MPTFDVTVTKRLRMTVSDFGHAAKLAENIETGDVACPDSVSVGDVRVIRVEAV